MGTSGYRSRLVKDDTVEESCALRLLQAGIVDEAIIQMMARGRHIHDLLEYGCTFCTRDLEGTRPVKLHCESRLCA